MNNHSTHLSSSKDAVHALPVTPASPASSLNNLLIELRQRQRRPVSTLGANVGSALNALSLNRLRSFLTALGIFIGVASVIGALTLTQGADAYVGNQLASLGTTIFVNGGSTASSGVSQGSGSLSSLTPKDAQAIQQIPHVIGISSIITSSEQAVYGNQSWQTTIEGVNLDYFAIQNLQLAQGSWLSPQDTSNGSTVAVLGSVTARNLLGTSQGSPIGQQVRIRDHLYRIAGVLMQQTVGVSPNNVIYIPLKAAQVRLKNTPFVDQIFVRADAIASVNQVQQAITTTLRKSHRPTSQGTDDFVVRTYTQVLQNAGLGDQVLWLLLVGIAGISLTVGGLGIMNIMLVSITERVWEIGIRIALGARRRDIRNQFLIEALILCMIGGVIGLLLGLLIGLAFTSSFNIPFVITPLTLIVPFAVSAAIALLFGIYPAIRASHLDPIIALRSNE